MERCQFTVSKNLHRQRWYLTCVDAISVYVCMSELCASLHLCVSTGVLYIFFSLHFLYTFCTLFDFFFNPLLLLQGMNIIPECIRLPISLLASYAADQTQIGWWNPRCFLFLTSNSKINNIHFFHCVPSAGCCHSDSYQAPRSHPFLLPVKTLKGNFTFLGEKIGNKIKKSYAIATQAIFVIEWF